MNDNLKKFAKNALSPILISFVAAVLLLFHYSAKQTVFENLALGEDNFSYYASLNGDRIHCAGIKDCDLCLEHVNKRRPQKIILWLGNSQLNSINQYKSGDKTAPHVLFESLIQRDTVPLTFSQPNANLQEHYVLFEYLLTKTKVNILLLPVCFDDIREAGIRDDIAAALKDLKTREALLNSAIGQRILRTAKSQGASDDDFAGVKATIQEHVEGFFEKTLNSYSSIWRARKEVRGVFFNLLYQLRNTVLNITPQSKRKLIKNRYYDNMSAFKGILKKARVSNIKVLVYIPPFRSDVKSPYDDNEYQQFKTSVKNYAGLYSAAYVDLEGIIPGELWGYKNSTALKKEKLELDFMHFKGQGHLILASRLREEIEKLLPAKQNQS